MSEESAAAAPEVIDNSSVETTIATTTPGTDVATPEFVVPEAYADKPWVKDVKDMDGLFKMTDDLKSMMGKRPAGIPQETASDEEKAAFFKEMGVPESIEGYELSAPQEGSEEFQSQMKTAMHKFNLTSEQAKGLDAAFNEIVAGLAPSAEANDVEFDKMTAEVFGDKKDAILSGVKALMSENSEGLPDSMKEAINNLPNKYLVPMSAIMNNIKAKYINEDSLPNGGTPPAGISPEDKRAEGRRLMALPEYVDKSHPAHAAVMAKVNACYS